MSAETHSDGNLPPGGTETGKEIVPLGEAAEALEEAAPGADLADAIVARPDAIAKEEIVLPPPLEWLANELPVSRPVLCYGWRLSERWGADRCPLVAAALAFFGLLSVFPMVLAAVAILSRILANNPEALAGFRSFVQSFFPGAAGEVTHQIDAVARATDPAALGLLAVASLLWSGRAYFDTLASILNVIWPHARPRPFLQHQLALWSLFAGAGALWLLSTLATFALQTVQALAQSRGDFFINRSPFVWDAAGRLLSFALTTLMFWLLYRFLPNVATRRRRRMVWGAALIGSIGWEGAKWLFTSVLTAHLSRYQATYGSAAGVVLTLLWIYLSSSILLLGAEAAAVYEELWAEKKASIQ
jgi:membrane protein